MLSKSIVLAVLWAAPSFAAFSIEWDRQANIKAFILDGRRLTPPTPYSYFELDGALADATPADGSNAYRLSAGKASAVIRVSSAAETRLHFEGTGVKKVGLVLTWPADSEFHLAEYLNVGRLLDRDMPPGESYKSRLRYNFFVVRAGGVWVRFRADEKRWHSRTDFSLARHPDMFTATFSWDPETDVSIGAFSSLEQVIDDHEKWMRNEAGVRPLAERPEAPAWLRDIKLVITADMMRGNWEIANDFQDVLNMAREISRIRNPKEVLFYVPGWQGAYDSTHPRYRPHPELGGDRKFKELMDYLHQAGFRLMIHSTGWGMDPYLDDIDLLDKLALKNKDGEYQGWQTPFPPGRPPSARLKFRTPQIALPKASAKTFTITTDPIPAVCEALFTVGGVKPGKHRIRLTAGRRTLITPTGWFESHSEYQFPFGLELLPGRNEVQVEVIGDAILDGAWYQIRDTYGAPSPFEPWTFPIFMADTAKPEFIKLFTESITSVVKEFGIDAVHIDASTFYQRPGGITPAIRELSLTLRKALPGVALAAEWFQGYEEMNFWQMVQSARQDMKNYSNTARCACDLMGVMPVKGVDAIYRWLDKRSPVCDFSRKYILIYPHLCAANAFVPVGKVCSTQPPRQMPPDKTELWDVLTNAVRLNFIPGLRVNYRGYGLDEDTRKALQTLP